LQIFLKEKLTFMVNSMVRSFLYEEEGQDMVEYSLLLGFVALGAVGVLSDVTTQISSLWSTVNGVLVSANAPAA
jgi:Flp pilus assembly pilin Flp